MLWRSLLERKQFHSSSEVVWRTRQQGYSIVRDDQGAETQADLMSLSIGVVTVDDGPFADIREITETSATARRESRMAWNRTAR